MTAAPSQHPDSLADGLAETGISRLTLHAWERRYGVVLSSRLAGGRRFLTAPQRNRLRLLKSCTDRGHRIGTIITLSDSALQRLCGDGAGERLQFPPLAPLLAAVDAHDMPLLAALLTRHISDVPALTFVEDVLSPLMTHVGDRWHDGTLPVHGEHAVSQVVSRLLWAAIDSAPPVTAGRPILIATLDGEYHEFGALALLLCLRAAGHQALYLGASLPRAEIAAAALRHQARLVAVSVLQPRRFHAETELQGLRLALAADCRLVAGGPGVARLRSGSGLEILRSIGALIESLPAPSP